MKGFGAFREDTEVDFTDIELAALVGPTGSGKSTIIDGITFALFGIVARYDDARAVAPVINQLDTEARVALVFDVGGESHTALRVVRRTADGATTKEARLERGETVLAGQAREMAPAVARLLGLDFDRFTKTVVLPQGRFAQFLHDKAGDRQELLRHLLDLGMYTRMGNEARSRASLAGAKLEELEVQLETSVPSEHEVVALEARTVAVKAAQTKLEGLLDELDGAGMDLEVAQAEIQRLDPLLKAVSVVSVPDAVKDLSDRLEAASDAVDRTDEAYRCKRAEEQEARSRAEEGPDLGRCRQLLGDRERLDQLEEEFDQLESEARQAANGAEGAREAHASAKQRVDSAFEALDRVRSVKRAESLVAQLREGEPCPVCRQTVVELPDHDIDAELAQLEATHTEVREALDGADADLRMAVEAVADASAKRDENERQRDNLAARLSGQPDAEKLSTEIAAAEALEAARLGAEEASAQAEQELAGACKGLQSLQGAEITARQNYGRVRDGVASLKPPEPAGALLDDWSALAAWAGQQVTSLKTEVKTAQERACAAENRKHDVVMQARDLCAPYFEMGDDPGRLRQDMAVAVDRADGDHRRAIKARKDRAELEKRIEELREEQSVLSQLGWLLRSDGFERWLLEEAVVGLVERANQHLLVLSGGQYSFIADETSFNICDHHNADEIRSAKTLSGGETFLASLSLALALRDSQTEIAAEGGARLDSLFLDEGFGTLDPDALDVVTGAIEELSSHGRMVCVVTHIREVADRMPVRFEVSKSPVSSSVERVEA
jgi:exonuclease SbcC